MTNDNPTLIAGFDDVMVHIRNQEKRIKELEKVNKEQFAMNEAYMEENTRTHKRYAKKIDELLSQKYELEQKVDEAQVVHKENLKYREEINTIKDAVENECQASGIMEIMNSRIEDAEKEVEEYKLKNEEQSEKMKETRKRANSQTQTVITQDSVIKNLLATLIANDKNGVLYDDGIELRMDWNLYGTNYHDIIEGVVDEMNSDDWNDDEHRSEIIYEGGWIRLQFNDTESEEETDEDA